MKVKLDSANEVLNALRGARDGLTREDLVATTPLSRRTISLAVSQLAELGLLVDAEDGGQNTTPGPAPKRVRLAAGPLLGGVDIGRHHVTVAVGDASGSIIATPNPERFDEELGPRALTIAAKMLKKTFDNAGLSPAKLATVGLGIAAPLTPDGRVASSDYAPGWPPTELAPLLQDALSTESSEFSSEVLACNDANVGVMGEVMYGAAQGCQTALFLKASTGIGLGMWLGSLFTGATGFAGEFGHTAAPSVAQDFIARNHPELHSRQRTCSHCKQLTCLENLCSCSAIAEQLVEAYPEHYHAGLRFDDVVARARDEPTGHPRCVLAIEYAGRRLGAALADLVRVLDPEVIVIGGFLATAKAIIGDRMTESVADASLSTDTPRLKFVKAAEIEYTEARGALALAINRTKLTFDRTSKTVSPSIK